MTRDLSRQLSAVVVERRQFAAPDGGGGRNLGRKVAPGSTPVDRSRQLQLRRFTENWFSRRRAQFLAAVVHRKPVLQEGGTVPRLVVAHRKPVR